MIMNGTLDILIDLNSICSYSSSRSATINRKRRMKSAVLIFSAILCTVNAYLAPWGPHSPISGSPPPIGSSVWPRPQTFTTIDRPPFLVDTANFGISIFDISSPETSTNCSFLEWARNHYTELIHNLRPDGPTEGTLKELHIFVSSCDLTSLENADEAYTLDPPGEFNEEYVAIASTFLGALRAMETFYQMLWPSDDNYDHYYVNASIVADQPRFKHRGIMLDTARHYHTEKLLLKILTIMMYNKFNVFHWHIVDDQSFPYVSKKFPELSEQGKFHSKAVYTPEAVQRIIQAAKQRGIRVILEFDTPGHAGGFGRSHREILTPCYGDGVNPGTPNHPEHTDYENIDPTNPASYAFMQEFFEEIASNVSQDSYVHLGMDEVYQPCWNSSPVIHKFMEDNNYTTISEVQGHYTKKLVKIVKDLGMKPISWQDPLDTGVDLDREVTVQVWKGYDWQNVFKNALARGHNVLLSACWYINLIEYGNGVWWDYYNCDPIKDVGIPEHQLDQVLGGEACLWSEFIDQTNMVQRLFPFASTVGAVLWDTDRENITQAQWRLDDFRCNMLRRGIPAKPLQIGHCGPLETQVNLIKWNYN